MRNAVARCDRGTSGISLRLSHGPLHSYTFDSDGSSAEANRPRLRAMLAATSLVGTAMLRYVMAVPPLTTLSCDEVVRLFAPTRYLTADAGELRLPAMPYNA